MRPREELYERIDRRIDAMIEAGFEDEVRRLLSQGYAPELPSLSAIGYREMIAYVQGEITLEEAVRLIRRATRTYVRRQANWFKPDDPDISWFAITAHTLDDLHLALRGWLAERIYESKDIE
jgi:tRNA dimethylallyltransferase